MAGGIHPPLATLAIWGQIGDPLHPSETRGWELVVLIIVLFSITLVTVLARLWARVKLQRNAGIDDLVIVAAMIPTAGLALSEALASRLYGFNRHAYDLTPALAVKSRKITMVIEATYILSTSLTKISILLFYKRMSDGAVSKGFRLAVQGCIAFVIAYMITFLLTLFLGCSPINSYWNQVSIKWALSHTEGIDYHCFDEPGNLLAASAFSIVQDFIACGMPTLLFWKLQLPQRQKIALGAIFGVGFFLCITGILRIIYISNIFFHTYDVTWASEPAWAWTAVEAHLAIICASAPALKVFFKQYLNVGSIGGSWKSSYRNHSYQRKGYKNKTDMVTYGTSSTASKTATGDSDSKITQPDVELGHIEVMHEVDIDTESMRTDNNDASTFYDDSHSASQEPLRSHSRHQSRNPERHSSTGRIGTWRT